MRKFHLPIDLQEEAIELYQQSFDNDEQDTVAIKRIQDLIVERGLQGCSDKTIYRIGAVNKIDLLLIKLSMNL